MLSDLKTRWRTLRPRSRHTATLSIIFGVIILAGVVVTWGTSGTKKPTVVVSEPKRTVSINPDLLEKTVTRKSLEQSAEIEKLRKELEEIRNGNTGGPQGEHPAPGPAVLTVAGQKEPASRAVSLLPPPPPPPPPAASPALMKFPPPPMQPDAYPAQPPVSLEPIGEIEVATNPAYRETTSAATAVETASADKKKAEGGRSIYLPPSYVEATLLSGLFAPTTEAARGNPIPVLIRIRDLAVLPNEVKMNLRGCYVIGEGVGNLADERAHIRLVSLSCISKRGEAVIDQKIKGFAVDSDGKLGLSGNVVSRMGSAIVRSLIAGFFGGFGDALKQSSTQFQNTGPLGVQTVMSDQLSDIAMAGLGTGVSNAAGELSRFYLDLAKQAVPVIEVGASKRHTLVFSEGANLTIKEFSRSRRSHAHDQVR